MSDWDVQIDGVDDVLRQLTGDADRVAAVVRQEVNAGADRLAGRIITDAPRRTGRLASSVEVTQRPIAGTLTPLARVTVQAPYAAYVEFGGRGRQPQPYVLPNHDAEVKAVQQRVAAKVLGMLK